MFMVCRAQLRSIDKYDYDTMVLMIIWLVVFQYSLYFSTFGMVDEHLLDGL